MNVTTYNLIPEPRPRLVGSRFLIFRIAYPDLWETSITPTIMDSFLEESRVSDNADAPMKISLGPLCDFADNAVYSGIIV